MSARKRRVVVGDVFSLEVERGVAHIQAIGVHPRDKRMWVVRVLDTIYAEPSADAAAIASGSDSYTVFVGDLGSEERDGRLKYIGRADLPPIHQNWVPIFRGNALHSGHPQRPEHWWLDDGVKEWRVGRLTKEQQALTRSTLVPILALMQDIDRGWDPNWEFKGDGAVEYLRPASEEVHRGKPEAKFFLLFTTKQDADAAAARLSEWDPSLTIESFDEDEDEDEDDGEDADDDVSADDVADAEEEPEYPFMRVLSTPREFLDIDELTALETHLEATAKAFNGVYDGNEIPIPGRS